MTKKRFTIEDDLFIREKTTQIVMEIPFKEDCKNMCELLNALHEENQTLRVQLNLCSDQRNEFHRGVRENVNRVGKLEKENEQLKKEVEDLKQALIRCAFDDK